MYFIVNQDCMDIQHNLAGVRAQAAFASENDPCLSCFKVAACAARFDS